MELNDSQVIVLVIVIFLSALFFTFEDWFWDH